MLIPSAKHACSGTDRPQESASPPLNEQNDQLVKSTETHLEPGKRLVNIDSHPDIMGYGWMYENTREEVIGMTGEAGFALERLETALLPEDYIYMFRVRQADED